MDREHEEAMNKLRNERLNYGTQMNENMMNYKNIRYLENLENIIQPNKHRSEHKIKDSEDGTIVEAIESIPELIRDEEKLNKTDNK